MLLGLKRGERKKCGVEAIEVGRSLKRKIWASLTGILWGLTQAMRRLWLYPTANIVAINETEELRFLLVHHVGQSVVPICYAGQEAGTKRVQAAVTEGCIFSVSIIIMKRHLVLLSQFLWFGRRLHVGLAYFLIYLFSIYFAYVFIR